MQLKPNRQKVPASQHSVFPGHHLRWVMRLARRHYVGRTSHSGVARCTSHMGGNVTSAGWQVTLCDPMWHVSSRSGVATLRTAIHLLLTYLLTNVEQPAQQRSVVTVTRHTDRLHCMPPQQSIVVSVLVCSSVCVCPELHVQSLPPVCMIPVSLARSSCVGVAIGYALPVLRMTSY